MNVYEPTDEQRASWDAWLATLPVDKRRHFGRLKPWLLFRMRSSGKRVYVLEYFEDDGTVNVAVTRKYNPNILAERNVFGVPVSDLVLVENPESRTTNAKGGIRV